MREGEHRNKTRKIQKESGIDETGKPKEGGRGERGSGRAGTQEGERGT